MAHPVIEHELVRKAASLAARAHRHQLRKDGVTPYIAHPMRVALAMATLFHETDSVILATSLLHDVIEDTLVDCDEIEATCGVDVARLVSCLTKDRRLTEPAREDEYFRRLMSGAWQARLVKLADLFDNLSDAWSPEALQWAIHSADRFTMLVKDERRLDAARTIVEQLVNSLRSPKSP